MAEPEIQWVHVSSLKKVPYRVGIIKGEHLTSPRKGEDLKIELAAKPTAHAHSIHVDWEVSDEGSGWKETSQAVRDLGVSRYKLYEAPAPAGLTKRPQPPEGVEASEAPPPIAYYILEFTTTHGNTFSFHDRGGDLYDYFAFSDGDHAIRYRATPGNAGIIGVI